MRGAYAGMTSQTQQSLGLTTVAPAEESTQAECGKGWVGVVLCLHREMAVDYL